MQPETISRLLDLNEVFYQTFARQFSDTRQRIQPGVRRLLPDLLAFPDLLDLGCGNGELARQLARQDYKGVYTGLDFSKNLLEIARKRQPPSDRYHFVQANISTPGWESQLPRTQFSAALAFAVLHHIPGTAVRSRFLVGLRSLLESGGVFIHSNWQFMRSERLKSRIQPWGKVGLLETDVEPGDYLLDWRQGGQGLRYVHLFTEEELARLAGQTGFTIQNSFYSDGKTGDLGLYQVWQAADDGPY